MSHMLPGDYFPCFASIEKEACRLYWESIPPGYFVAPCSVIDDWFSSQSPEWEGRRDLWLGMFRFTRSSVEILGVEIEVYVDGENFQLDWLLYPPISSRADPAPCRQMTYSDV